MALEISRDESFLRLFDKIEVLEVKQRAKDVDPRMRGAENTALRVIAELSKIGEVGAAFHLALAFVKVNRHDDAAVLFQKIESLVSAVNTSR